MRCTSMSKQIHGQDLRFKTLDEIIWELKPHGNLRLSFMNRTRII
jgi:hypothetical protein